MRVRSLAALVTASVGVLTLLGAAPSASTGASGAPRHAAADSPPNIVLILADDMRADELRLMPNVRRLLVREGTRWRNAISPHPVCCPARAELVTGQYGQNNGVRNNKGRWGGYDALKQPGNTVAAWLQEAGYRTSHHGKYLNRYEKVASPHEPGWTRWDTQVGGVYSYERLAVFADGDRYEQGYVSRIIGRRGDRTISRFSRSDAPFFTVINHVAPHGARRDGTWHFPVPEERHRDAFPRLMPPSWDKASFQEEFVTDLPADLQRPLIRTRDLVRLTRARARALLSVDDAVARTVARLRKLGELSNTYVVFASDNGFQIGEHRQRGKNMPFDESFDIPLVVRGPGIARGAVIGEPVTLVDLAATFLDWAGGVPPGRPLDGLSLEELGTEHPRDTLLVQIGDSADDETDGWRYRGVTTSRYLLATHAGASDGVLFDRRIDPDATINLIDDPAYADVRRELLARIHTLSSCAGQTACNQAFGPVPPPR